jgi:hypothetical protein
MTIAQPLPVPLIRINRLLQNIEWRFLYSIWRVSCFFAPKRQVKPIPRTRAGVYDLRKFFRNWAGVIRNCFRKIMFKSWRSLKPVRSAISSMLKVL